MLITFDSEQNGVHFWRLSFLYAISKLELLDANSQCFFSREKKISFRENFCFFAGVKFESAPEKNTKCDHEKKKVPV